MATKRTLERRAAALEGWARRYAREGETDKARVARADSMAAKARIAIKSEAALRGHYTRLANRAKRARGKNRASLKKRARLQGAKVRDARDRVSLWTRSSALARGEPIPPVRGVVHSGTHAEPQYARDQRTMMGLLEVRNTLDVLQVVPFGRRKRGRLPRGARKFVEAMGVDDEAKERILEAIRLSASDGGVQVLLEVIDSDD